MIKLLNYLILIIPPVFAWIIHNYLTHGAMSTKRKALLMGLYVVLINALVLGASYIRGIRGLNFADMTVSYKFKYLGLGLILGFVLPFVVCLLFEDRITLGGVRRYAKRFIGDTIRYLPYAVKAAKSDLRSEVRGSLLDWLWWMIEPLCTMLIYTIIFGFVFKASENFFPAFIFIGITLWGFFSRSVNGSVNMIRNNRGIITKVYMPKYILLLAKMFVNAFKMLISFGVTLILMIFLKVPFSFKMLCFVPIIIVTFLFTFGVGTIMMHYGVYVNDLAYITGIVLNMLMYLSGPFYSVSRRIPAPFGIVLETYNPVAFLMSQMRNVLLYDMAPNWMMLGMWTLISLIIIALGCFNIYHNENSYVKVI